MPAVDRQQIIDALWSTDLPPEYKVWAILDGARDDRIYSAVTYLHPESYCLYRGKLPPELRATAPYLVKLEPEDTLFSYILELGWGNSWGIFLRAKAAAEDLRRHFRSFLIVRDEAGKRLIFRYYDPRVLRVYLPTCLPSEVQMVFGPVSRFLLEDGTSAPVLEYAFDGITLSIRELAVATSRFERQ